MIRGIYTSSSGMQAEALRQETIANNLANLDTAGFKRDLAVLEARENLDLMRINNPVAKAPDALSKRVAIGDLGMGVMLDRVYKRHEQGHLKQTENPFDLAIEGQGFFAVEDPATGDRLYTRAGAFTKDASGRMVTPEGRVLLGSNGPVQIGTAGSVSIGNDGLVTLDGRATDRIPTYAFEKPEDVLTPVGDTAYRFDGQGEPAAGTGSLIHQGMIEASNSNSVREMVGMITALRQYEANQKALTSQDETLGKGVNEIART